MSPLSPLKSSELLDDPLDDGCHVYGGDPEEDADVAADVGDHGEERVGEHFGVGLDAVGHVELRVALGLERITLRV